MLRRLPAYLSLICYSAIALCGQGLHEFLDDDGDHAEQPSVTAVASQTISLGDLGSKIGSPQSHAHDCDNCPICQFQAIGQHFIAPPPTDVGLVKCDILSDNSTDSVYFSALYSPAQPRGPPLV